jgi:hypothetical protein
VAGVSSSAWILKQAAELVLEQTLELLDGCDDDRVQPALVFKAVRRTGAPDTEVEPFDCTAGELRERIAGWMARARARRGYSVSGVLGRSGGGVSELVARLAWRRWGDAYAMVTRCSRCGELRERRGRRRRRMLHLEGFDVGRGPGAG